MSRRRFCRPILTRLALSAMTVFGGCALSTAVAALSHEEWVSAFVRFVEWPVPVSVIEGELVVCQKPDTRALEFEGKQVRGLTMKLRLVARPKQLVGCHIYAEFAMDEASWKPWLKEVNLLNTAATRKAGASERAFPFILAVGQGAQFCDLGGAICVVVDTVTGVESYRLNLDTLSRVGFRVDSQLLRSQPSRPAKAQ